MPIYEYQCNACHHHFDLIQKVSDQPARVCPECSKDTVVRLISAPGFQLKGTGWYATDYKNPAKPAAASEKKSETTSSAASTASSTSTKDGSN